MIERLHSLLAVPFLLLLISAPADAAQDGGTKNPDEGAGAPSSAPLSDDPLGFLEAARKAGHGRLAQIVATAIRQANLCTTTDFSHVSVDAKRGIFEHEKECRRRLRSAALWRSDRAL